MIKTALKTGKKLKQKTNRKQTNKNCIEKLKKKQKLKQEVYKKKKKIKPEQKGLFAQHYNKFMKQNIFFSKFIISIMFFLVFQNQY